MASEMVSCICPTYGRPLKYQHLLEEAIESFLQQDYPRKELIVLNDCATQTLVCNHKDVRVVNQLLRCPTLGQKYNALVELAKGTLICPWEDDDISLPWRLSRSVEMLGDSDYYNPHGYWFWSGGQVRHPGSIGVAHNCSIYRKTAWAAVGKYPEISGPQDTQMDVLLRNAGNAGDGKQLAMKDWWYMYRWGMHASHLSAFFPKCQEFYDKVGKQQPEPGEYKLQPKWQQDYVSLCHAAAEKMRNNHANHNQT